MAGCGRARVLRKFTYGFERLILSDPLVRCLAPRFARSMATEAPLPAESYILRDRAAPSSMSDTINPRSAVPAPNSQSSDSQVLTTIYSWPTLEPVRFEQYPSNHLHLPLRRDILHRAVVYEGDKTRQGTASTKWRKDIHGSGRKLHSQKGTGRARVGDKKSPTRKGGGVAFGPHPRDFSTGLQRKVYDLAWRTALSHRYRRGELVIVDNKITIGGGTGPQLLINIFKGNQWGSAFGRSTLVTKAHRPGLFERMAEIRKHGIVKDMFDMDVKDLLETRRIIIEKQALDTILKAHTSDVGPKRTIAHAALLVARAQRASGLVEKLNEVAETSPKTDPNEEHLDELDEILDPEENASSDGPRT